MRIAHFIQRYPPALGGSEAYFARLSRFLVEQGDEVTVFTTTGDALDSFWDRQARQLPAGEERLDGVRVIRHCLRHVPVGHRYLLKALSLIPVPRWQALTVPFNPIAPSMWNCSGEFDLIHAGAFPYSFPLECSLRLARRLHVPFLITPFIHLGDPDEPHDRTRRAYTTPALLQLLRSAERIFVQTEGERDELASRGIDEQRLVLQGLGVDPATCTGGDRWRERRRRQLGEEVVIGHLANNSVEKGSVDLLLACQRLWQRGVRFTVVLAGSEMPNFLRFWERFEPLGRVVRCGMLSEQEKRDFFAAIDLFALPSRSDSFGLVLPEAWANAIPCVGYRAGGIAWVIRDGLDGLLVKCGDLEALAAALRLLVENTDLRKRLGETGRKRLPEFDWQAKLRLARDTCLECIERDQRRKRSARSAGKGEPH